MTVCILFSTREPHPTFRADIAVLFGKYLPRLGITSDLVALKPAGLASPPWTGGGSHCLEAPSRGWRKWLASLAQDVRLLWLGFGPCDVIQVRDNAVGAFFGLICARLTRKPFCYWMSFPFAEAWIALGQDPSFKRRRLRSIAKSIQGYVAYWLLYRVILPRADHVFVQSQRMAVDVAARATGCVRMTAVPMGVDLEMVEPCGRPADNSKLSRRRVVVYLGALERIRRPELLLDAIALVRASFPDVLLMLVGDSHDAGDRDWLQQAIADRNLDEHVRVTGWLPTKDAWAWLRVAEIGLTAVPRDPVFDVASPTKAVEYLAHGLPTVANDSPDQESVMRESGGGLIAPLTPDGFAQAIVELLADPVLARRMGRRGREWVRDLRGYDILAAKVAQVYRTLLSSKRSRSAQAAAIEGGGKRKM